MKDMFAQGGSGSTGIKTNKQAVARDFGVKQSEVTYATVGQDISGYKVLYDKASQRAFFIPAGLPSGSNLISFTNGVLTTSSGAVDLGSLAVDREDWVRLQRGFSEGVTLLYNNDVIFDGTNWYRWAGTFPTNGKVVSSGSTPASTGGINSNAWVPVGAETLRKQLADPNSIVSIAGASASLIGRNATGTKYLEAPDIYDLIIAYGQSNALGSAALSGDTTGYPVPSVKSLMFDTTDGTIKPITQSMPSSSGEASTGHAWCAFANEWYRLSGRGSVVLNAAKGAQSLDQLVKGTSTYTAMVAAVASAKARMATQGMTLGNVYVIFHQGEADQLSETPFDTYSTALTTMIDNLRTDLAMTRFGNCTVGCPTNRQEYTWATIQNSQKYTVNRRTNAVTVFDGCPAFLLSDGNIGAEGVHYTQQGYNTMGTGAARGLWSAENGSVRTKSEPDLSDYNRDVAPWARAKNCYAVAAFASSTSSWAILNRNNGDTFVRPANINSVTVAADGNSLLFSVADNGRSWFNYDGQVSRNAASLGVYAYIDRINTTNFNLRATMYIDLDLVINVATGAVSSPRAGSANAWLNSLVTVAVSPNTAVVTHGSTSCPAQVSHYAGTTLADTGATVSVNCSSNTQTRVYLANATTDQTVLLSLKRVLLTPAQLQTLTGAQVMVRGVYAPDL